MYKNNSRDSSKFKVCSPFELSSKLKVLCSEIAYFSYTKRSCFSPTARLSNLPYIILGCLYSSIFLRLFWLQAPKDPSHTFYLQANKRSCQDSRFIFYQVIFNHKNFLGMNRAKAFLLPFISLIPKSGVLPPPFGFGFKERDWMTKLQPN